MNKRANHEGSVYKRQSDGLYVATIRLPDGRRRAYAGKTRAAATAKAEAAKAEIARTGTLPTGRESTGDYLTRWVESVRSTIRPNTHDGYERTLRLHVVPEIGRIPLARLGPQDLASTYQRMLDKGLSPRSAQIAHAVLHRALKQAERWGLITRNPARLVDPPRVPRVEIRPLAPAEVRTMIGAVHGDKHDALYVLALTTGMRWGELTGLRWRDLDLDAGSVSVRQQAQRTREGWTFTEPKTAKGRRAITLPGIAVAALKRHRGDDKTVVRLPVPDALVFPNEQGHPLERQNFARRHFKPLLDRIDEARVAALGRPLEPGEAFPRIRFHDLRHSAATLLLAEGVHPKIVQERLGHATIGITLDTYSHILPSMQQETAERLDRFFGSG